MTPTIGEQLSPRVPSDKASPSQDAPLNASYPRYVWRRSGFRSQSREDQVAFRHWRLAFFVFYSTVALLAGGLVVIANHPRGAVASAVAPPSPAITLTDASRHRN